MSFLIVFAMTFGLTHFEAIFPLYVVQAYGFSTAEIAILLTLCSLIGTVNQIVLTDRICRRFGEKKIIGAMLTISAVTLACLLLSGGRGEVRVHPHQAAALLYGHAARQSARRRADRRFIRLLQSETGRGNPKRSLNCKIAGEAK